MSNYDKEVKEAWDRWADEPTIIVKPIKHGRNLSADYPSLFECSVCGYTNNDTYTGDIAIFNYCPNCGARMDEVEE